MVDIDSKPKMCLKTCLDLIRCRTYSKASFIFTLLLILLVPTVEGALNLTLHNHTPYDGEYVTNNNVIINATTNGSSITLSHNNDLVLWWTFNNNNTHDESGNGNNRSANNFNTSTNYNYSVGKFGNSLSNIPQRYTVDVVNLSQIITNQNSWTISFWFNMTEAFNVRSILSFNEQLDISFDRTGVDDIYQVVLANSSCSHAKKTNTGIIGRTWHYISVSYNGTNMTTVFDNTALFSSSCTSLTNPFADSNNLLFGGEILAQIDDFKIYNRPLNINESRAEYNATRYNLTTDYQGYGNHNFTIYAQNSTGSIVEVNRSINSLDDTPTIIPVSYEQVKLPGSRFNYSVNFTTDDILNVSWNITYNGGLGENISHSDNASFTFLANKTKVLFVNISGSHNDGNYSGTLNLSRINGSYSRLVYVNISVRANAGEMRITDSSTNTIYTDNGGSSSLTYTLENIGNYNVTDIICSFDNNYTNTFDGYTFWSFTTPSVIEASSSATLTAKFSSVSTGNYTGRFNCSANVSEDGARDHLDIGNRPTINLIVSSVTASTSGGGGGGGFKRITEIKEVTKEVVETNISKIPDVCGNGICEEGEDPLDCPRDCIGEFKIENIFCTPFLDCGNWKESWFINIIFIVLVGYMIFFMYTGKDIKKKLSRRRGYRR